MTLRDDVRDYFEREARRMPAPSGLREDVASRAVSARTGASPAFRWAALVAAMLALAIVVGLVATGAFRQSKGVPVGPPIPVTPGTHGSVFDVSFANSTDGWALIGSLTTDTAQFEVEATHDGGQTWLTPVKVGPLYNFAGFGDSPRHMHFVDRDNGFVYGLGSSFATHDGGRTWADAGLTQGIVTVAGQEGITWAVAETSTADAVRVSPDGGKTWLSAANPPFVPGGATSFGLSGLLITSRDSSDMALTIDSGGRWLDIPGRCPASTAIHAATTADGSEIWEVCTPAPPSSTVPLAKPLVSSVFVSEDSGRTWVQRTSVSDGGVSNDILISPRTGTAILGTDTTGMMISIDAGQSWQPSVTDPNARVQAIGAVSYSADGRLAAAVGYNYVVFISRDGGNTWNRAPSQP